MSSLNDYLNLFPNSLRGAARESMRPGAGGRFLSIPVRPQSVDEASVGMPVTMTLGDMFNAGLDAAPGPGDVKSVLEGIDNIQRGNYGWGALGLAGGLPVVAGLGTVGRKAKELVDYAKLRVGAPEFRKAPIKSLNAALEQIIARNRAKGIVEDVGTGAINDEIARRNAVRMLKLPPENTAADRMKAMGGFEISARDYGGEHRPPMSDTGAPLHDLTGGGEVYPDDVYSSMAARYYGHGEDPAEDAALFRKIHALRGKPDETVAVYRAVPTDVMKKHGNMINHGDWVTISRKYAVDHGEGALDGDYKIQRGMYPAKALFTNGDSPYEYGLDRTQYFADGPADMPYVRLDNAARNRFAAFDPKKRREHNLLASMTGASVLAPTLADYFGGRE